MEPPTLLSEIEAFCKRHDMTEATFGRLAVNDWKLVNDMRGLNRPRPRRLFAETADAVCAFMAERDAVVDHGGRDSADADSARGGKSDKISAPASAHA